MLANKYQDYMFGLIKKVIDEIGPRPACSEAEKKLGRLLVEEWKPICDRVDVEQFACSPSALQYSWLLMGLFYFATIIIYWFFPPLALAIATINCIIGFEILRVREFLHFLFPRKQGENVIGAVRPKSEAIQRVIVSAHMDSIYEDKLIYYLKSAALPVLLIGNLGLVMAFGGSLVKTIAYFDVFSSAAALTGIGIIMIALAPFVGLTFFSSSNNPVPGAMDNMSGVSVVAGLGQYLNEAKRNQNWFPERTEVVMVGISSEEAGGHPGSMRYVRKHVEELKAIPTYVLNLDGICDERFPAVFESELFFWARHDPGLVKIAQEVAASHHWPMRVMAHFLPSDGASFSLNKIPATTIMCANPSTVTPIYHTRNDTYDHVRPEALSVGLQLIIDMIKRIDKS